MTTYLEFHERKPNGCIACALGSDSIIPVDGRLGLLSQTIVAARHARSLVGVGKAYCGFAVLRGSSLGTAKRVGKYQSLHVVESGE